MTTNICRCCGDDPTRRYICGYCKRFCLRADGTVKPSRRRLPHNPHKVVA